jgi:hypothetical protein
LNINSKATLLYGPYRANSAKIVAIFEILPKTFCPLFSHPRRVPRGNDSQTTTMAAPVDNRPDFVRYYLQFPPVTRTLLTAIVLVSTAVQFGLISKYTLFGSFLGSFLRFFDAGWGLWFLMTLITCTCPLFFL